MTKITNLKPAGISSRPELPSPTQMLGGRIEDDLRRGDVVTIATAFVSNNDVAISDVALLITEIGRGLDATAGAEPAVPPEPAVPIRNSIKKDYVICLEDGKKLKMLKRHLMTHYGMTPDDYRAKWDLPSDYPMVAPAYAEVRRALAKKIGLGRAPGSGRKKKVAGA